MATTDPISYGKYYHVYNCGINGCNLFDDKNDYEHFLQLYKKYISTIADTYAWCLMKNHFHLLIRIKEDDEIGRYAYSPKIFSELKLAGKFNKSIVFDDVKWLVNNQKSTGISENKKPNPTHHFSHLFISYAKYYNAKYNRHGSLFEKPFHRKCVNAENYFQHLVIYIHNNPVKHGFVKHAIEWGWSSYLTVLSNEKTQLKRQETLKYFNNTDNFKRLHSSNIDLSQIENMLGVL